MDIKTQSAMAVKELCEVAGLKKGDILIKEGSHTVMNITTPKKLS